MTSIPGVKTRKAYAESDKFFAAFYVDNPGLSFDTNSTPTVDNLKFYEIKEDKHPEHKKDEKDEKKHYGLKQKITVIVRLPNEEKITKTGSAYHKYDSFITIFVE